MTKRALVARCGARLNAKGNVFNGKGLQDHQASCPRCIALKGEVYPAGKSRFSHYVVWAGRQPGIYTNWTACKAQIDNFPGARFKGYHSLGEAQDAFDETAQPKQSELDRLSDMYLSLDVPDHPEHKILREPARLLPVAEETVIDKLMYELECQAAKQNLKLFEIIKRNPGWKAIWNMDGTLEKYSSPYYPSLSKLIDGEMERLR